MAPVITTILCIAMIVVGGVTLSQGVLTSADLAAVNMESMSVMEGEIVRTDLTITRAAQLDWANYLRVTVKNSGQIKLTDFEKWDVIVSYIDSDSNFYSKWLSYNAALLPITNEWQKARIGLSGPIDFFEPGILNPFEEMVILISLDPLPQESTEGDVSIASPNGVYDSLPFANLNYALLTAESENITLANTKYYELAEAETADGPAIIAGTNFSNKENGTKLLYDIDQPDRPAKLLYPLIGIDTIPAAFWSVYYRGYVGTNGDFPKNDSDVCFNIDILIRQADGSIRATIDTGVAPGWVEKGQSNTWLTFSGTYNFPGYSVVDDSDYLEIDFNVTSKSGPNPGEGWVMLSIDDSTLEEYDQTRIEAYKEE